MKRLLMYSIGVAILLVSQNHSLVAHTISPLPSATMRVSTVVKFSSMQGWPVGNPRVGILFTGWEEDPPGVRTFDLTFNAPPDLISANLTLRLYAKTDANIYAKASEILLNGYVMENDWIYTGAWWDCTRDDWVTWKIPVEFVHVGPNLLHIDIKVESKSAYRDSGEFYLYDLSYVGMSYTKEVLTMSFDCSPKISDLVIDGVPVSRSELPHSLSWEKGTNHTFYLPSAVLLDEHDNRIRYVFNNWSDGSTAMTRTVTVYNANSYVARFRKQYYLTLECPYGTAIGGGWYDTGLTATFSVSPTEIEYQNGTKCVFVSWVGDSSVKSPSGNIVMSSPKNLEATWKTQYLVTVESEYGSPTGGGWCDSGQTISCSVSTPVDQGNGTRRVFVGWTGGLLTQQPVIQLAVTEPKNLVVIWKTQYFLKVISQHGSTQGEGWYDRGALAQVSVDGQNVEEFPFTYTFVEWRGAMPSTSLVSGSITMDRPNEMVVVWDSRISDSAYGILGAATVIVGLLGIWYVLKALNQRFRRQREATQVW